MKKALVTGGCGFIGSNLTKELVKQGWQVDVVDNMSNGHLELLDSLKKRVLPDSYFLRHYTEQVKNREQEEVLVIQDDFSSTYMLDHIHQENYNVNQTVFFLSPKIFQNFQLKVFVGNPVVSYTYNFLHI